jgi:protein TonB
MRVPKWVLLVIVAGVGLSAHASMMLGGQAAKRIPKVAPAVMAKKLVVRVEPVYPLMAREYSVAGPVKLDVVVGVEGKVESAEVVSGPPMLRAAAIDAVRRWVYKPTKVNGVASEVETAVVVNFSLKSTLAGQVLPE